MRKLEIAQLHIGLSQAGIGVDQFLLRQLHRVGDVERLAVIPGTLVVIAAADVDIGQVRIGCHYHPAAVCLQAVVEHLFEIFERRIVHAGAD